MNYHTLGYTFFFFFWVLCNLVFVLCWGSVAESQTSQWVTTWSVLVKLEMWILFQMVKCYRRQKKRKHWRIISPSFYLWSRYMYSCFCLLIPWAAPTFEGHLRLFSATGLVNVHESDWSNECYQLLSENA